MSEALQGEIARRHAALVAEALTALGSKETESIAHLRFGLHLYLTDRVETGGFLRCVLENDLARAITHAHPSLTMSQLKTLVLVVSSSFPDIAWGSPEKVSEWLKEEASQ